MTAAWTMSYARNVIGLTLKGGQVVPAAWRADRHSTFDEGLTFAGDDGLLVTSRHNQEK